MRNLLLIIVLLGWSGLVWAQPDQVTLKGCDQGSIQLPVVFKPNQDSTLRINVTNLQEARLSFYDWRGTKVFTKEIEFVYTPNAAGSTVRSTACDTGWEGTQNGKTLNNGVYIYIIEGVCSDGKAHRWQGQLTLNANTPE